MPEAIPAKLEQRLRRTLLRCGPFESDAALCTVFVDARIAGWRDHIPDSTPSRARRVEAFIESLRDRRNANGEEALVLFLHVLADRTPSGDSCRRELATCAAELAALSEVTPDEAPPTSQSTPQAGSKYNITIHGGQIGVIGDGAKIEGGMHFDSEDI